MTYAETRDEETLRLLTPAIDAFITQCQAPAASGSACARQTVFFFPGGMASQLVRAREKFDDDDPSAQTFKYDDVWVTPATPIGGARDLKMYRHSSGTFRDKGDRIIVADDVVSLDLLGGSCTPHDGLISWCRNNGLNLFVFPWDWRRRLNEIATFFVSKFLPYFRTRVMNGGCPDPLASFALVGHSFGGMIANLLLRNNAPIMRTVTQVITVATPFYGYAGQVHRWFEGEGLLNLLGLLEQEMIETISSMPGLYTLHFLDGETWDANATALTSGAFPIANYPSLDASDPTVRADPYNPDTYGRLVRYPGMTGFDIGELEYAELQFKMLASPMDPALLLKFHNIRGVQTALDGTTPLNDTPGSVTWNWIATNFDARDAPPIADVTFLPGDGTQPAWTTCLVTNAPARCITVKGTTIDHMFMMNHTAVLQAIGAILCPTGAAVSPTETAQPDEASDDEMADFLEWLSKNLLAVRRIKRFDDLEFLAMVKEGGFEGRLPNLARRFISDVMKKPGPERLHPHGGQARRPRPPQGPEQAAAGDMPPAPRQVRTPSKKKRT